ncbi:uncharacterized protein LOC110915746 isoform X3 [Helianthus annuus]|uniref:uncharacterized protein LOC110915746 isoform X3 n=1 Tax=Helianthus annuus TaxID=4232 RepID=UPI000B903493|nr:uncharacterized protein LOC110915746 isoform X3 [Helianthus annuus]
MCRPSIRYQRVRLGFPKEEPPLAFCYTSTIHVARHIGNFNRRLDFTAILVHRWLPGSRKKKKWVHLWLQGVALATGIFGIWTKFQGTEGVVANFYSLHFEACSYNCSCHYASHSCSRSSTERYMSITSQVNLHSSDLVSKHHHYCCHLRS